MKEVAEVWILHPKRIKRSNTVVGTLIQAEQNTEYGQHIRTTTTLVLLKIPPIPFHLQWGAWLVQPHRPRPPSGSIGHARREKLPSDWTQSYMSPESHHKSGNRTHKYRCRTKILIDRTLTQTVTNYNEEYLLSKNVYSHKRWGWAFRLIC